MLLSPSIVHATAILRLVFKYHALERRRNARAINIIAGNEAVRSVKVAFRQHDMLRGTYCSLCLAVFPRLLSRKRKLLVL